MKPLMMNGRRPALKLPLIAAALIFSIALPSQAQVSEDVRRAFQQWAVRSLHPVTNEDLDASTKDLRPMRAMIGDARIVALSEGVHAATEPLVFRNRLFKYLVEDLGFTAIVIESGLAESRVLNDYVAGGSGDLDAIVKHGFSWGHHTFRQNRELVRWMREYNARLPRDAVKLQIFGMDIPGSPGNRDATLGPQTPLESALEYVRAVDPDAAMQLRSRIAPALPQLSDTNGYGDLKQPERDALTAAIADLVSLLQRRRFAYIARSSKDAYEWSERTAIGARQSDAWFRQMPLGWKLAHGFDWTWDAMNVRDRAMADNFEWILDLVGPRSRVLVFASVTHIASTPWANPNGLGREIIPFGAYAKARFGAEAVSVFNTVVDGEIVYCSGRPRRSMPLKSPPPSSIEALFASANVPRYFLDLRKAPRSVSAWLSDSQDHWNGFASRQLATTRAFDIALFLSPVTSDCVAEEPHPT